MLHNKEGTRSLGEPDPQWTLAQAKQTKDQKREKSKPYVKRRVPEALLTTASPEEIKLALEQDHTLDKVREMLENRGW